VREHAVDLHDEAGFKARKVCDKGADGVLTSPDRPVVTSLPQTHPQQHFGQTHPATKLPGQVQRRQRCPRRAACTLRGHQGILTSSASRTLPSPHSVHGSSPTRGVGDERGRPTAHPDPPPRESVGEVPESSRAVGAGPGRFPLCRWKWRGGVRRRERALCDAVQTGPLRRRRRRHLPRWRGGGAQNARGRSGERGGRSAEKNNKAGVEHRCDTVVPRRPEFGRPGFSRVRPGPACASLDVLISHARARS
jgi:hypothetical protein